jgi:hypothetical protein
MQWVRSASWLLASTAALSCTRGNPAFETSGDETFTEDGDTRVETEDSDTGTIAECDYDEGQALTIKLPQPCGETNENTLRYERSFLVVTATSNGWSGGLCSDPTDLDCLGDCPIDVPQSIEIGPFDVSGIAGAGACLRIKAAQIDPTLESCSFDTIGIWQGATPIVVAAHGSAVIGEALADAGAIVPQPVLAENPACDCVEECCVVSPGDYAFDVEGQQIPVGSSAQLAAHPYMFHSLSAYNPTGCAENLEQAWGTTYSQ